MWFVKSRRAQSDTDFETWVEGGVSPTLNAFDNTGDSRATVVIVFAPGPMVRLGGNVWEGVVPTLRAEAKRGDAEPHVLIIDGTRVDDVRVYDDEITPCLKSRMGTGGNNVPFVAFASNQRSEVRDLGDIAVALSAEPGTNQQTYIAQETDMTAYNIYGGNKRPDRPEGGFYVEETDTTKTLDSSSGLNPSANQGGTAIVQETTHDVIGTIQARSYKGPNHENARDGQLVIQETDMTDVNGSDIAATLRGFGHGWQGQHNSTNAVAQETDMTVGPIAFSHYSSELSPGDMVPTLRSGTNGTGHAVAQETDMTDAIPIQGTIIGRQDHNGPQGKGFGNPGDPSYTLDSVSQHGVATTMQVRRLTPIECEKLMGWKENHTLPRADGKTNSDTTRYKMCGNGVASPVAQWIGEQLMAVHRES